jgi:hypothetical protein
MAFALVDLIADPHPKEIANILLLSLSLFLLLVYKTIKFPAALKYSLLKKNNKLGE